MLNRVLVIEHEAKCPLAHVGTWLRDAGCEVDVVRPYLAEELPSLDEYAALLVLGGTMGAGDDHDAPWLVQVRELIRSAAFDGVPTLGICLGHQLVAVALGGDVSVNLRGQQLGLVETGWLPAAADDPLLSPTRDGGKVRGIHWNNDIVSRLPQGATVLAQTPAGEPQVVRFAPTVWGVQLHPEADEVITALWAEGDLEEHKRAGINQAKLLADIAEAREELDQAWQPVLARFAKLVQER